MPPTRDVVIVGAGHNGLVAAFYLAQAGLKPLVLEGRELVGGAAVTEEFHPGFKCSTVAHSAGPLWAQIATDIGLDRRGAVAAASDPAAVALDPAGRPLVLHRDPNRAAAEIAGFSQKDALKFPEFARALARVAGFIASVLEHPPPPVDGLETGDWLSLLKTGKAFRALGERDIYRLLRWTPMPVADLVGEWFETELLRGAVATRGIFGTFLGPWSAGSSAVLLLRAAADPHPVGSAWQLQGGLGALTQALARAAAEAGAEIRTGARVASIATKEETATGVVLEGGEEIPARAVFSNADPKRTFLRLVGPTALNPDFVLKLQNYRSHGTVAKVNLALDALPEFRGLTSGAARGRILVAPELDALERAFDAAKYGDISPSPYLDLTIPTLVDPSLAPSGKHVMSICAQFAPYKLKQGDWNSRRDELADVVLRTLADYAPGLPNRVLARQVLSPLDLEAQYGLTGGQPFHGELTLDQLFTMRPILGWARYRTPIRGLYLCGSGAHPGSGLTGLSGHHAAKVFLHDRKRR